MIWWLVFTIIFIAIQALFALFEMACVSFNKVRLQYYVSKEIHSAKWIHSLLKKPSRLFGMTLLGINSALQIGSECSRMFYESIHLDPDFAPISQVFIVVLFGELVPMFIARRHPERIALFFAPLMIFLAKLFFPITWSFEMIAKGVQRLVGNSMESTSFPSREEIKMAFGDTEKSQDEFNYQVQSIFQLKNLTAEQLMKPLKSVQLFPSTITFQEIKRQLNGPFHPFFLIYQQVPRNLVSVIDIHDFFTLSKEEKIVSLGRSPWFVTKNTSILKILDQFKLNNQRIAVILDENGHATGILSLDQIMDAIFGPEQLQVKEIKKNRLIHRTLRASMTIAEFNKEFYANLSGEPEQTLEDLILSYFDHPVSRDESIEIGDFEFIIIEPTISGIKTISVKTLQE